jgi:hypothetical protein
LTDLTASQSLGVPASQLVKVVNEESIATILGITVKAWPQVIAGKEVDHSSREPDISAQLRREMIAEKNRRNPRPALLFLKEVPVDEADGSTDRGRIDIRVGYSLEEDEYFAMECKKVGARDTTKAKDYIDEGVHRFVTGKYSPNLSHGGMIGYVYKGSCAETAKLIEYHIETYNAAKTNACAQWPWQPEKRFGKHKHLYSTMHTQDQTTNDITLLHLFLPLPGASMGGKRGGVTRVQKRSVSQR